MILIITIIAIILAAIMIGLESCILWGLGVLICKLFGLSFTVTFWHGLGAYIILQILSIYFNKGKK